MATRYTLAPADYVWAVCPRNGHRHVCQVVHLYSRGKLEGEAKVREVRWHPEGKVQATFLVPVAVLETVNLKPAQRELLDSCNTVEVTPRCPGCLSRNTDEDSHSMLCNACGNRWDPDTGAPTPLYCVCGEDHATKRCTYCSADLCDSCYQQHRCQEGMDEAQVQRFELLHDEGRI